jgi:undecaprenyl-diphosphatase
MWETLLELDHEFFNLINSSSLAQYKQFWITATAIETWTPLYLLFFYLLYKKHSTPFNIIAMVSTAALAACTLLLTNLTKNNVQRLRPNNDPLLLDTINILQEPHNYSFWSGHAAVSFAVTVFVLLLLYNRDDKKWYLLFFIWPVIFAFSRIVTGVHFPSDVAVGAAVGISLGVVAYRLLWVVKQRLPHQA